MRCVLLVVPVLVVLGACNNQTETADQTFHGCRYEAQQKLAAASFPSVDFRRNAINEYIVDCARAKGLKTKGTTCSDNWFIANNAECWFKS